MSTLIAQEVPKILNFKIYPNSVNGQIWGIAQDNFGFMYFGNNAGTFEIRWYSMEKLPIAKSPND